MYGYGGLSYLVLLAHIALLHGHVVSYVVIALEGDSQPPIWCACICLGDI